MLSHAQPYSIFRPWDSSDQKSTLTSDVTNIQDNKKKKIEDSKRENRLRKIRGQFKKSDSNTHQDATVSTTTRDTEETNLASKTNPVDNLTACCDRLLPEPIKEEIQLPKPAANLPQQYCLPQYPAIYHPSYTEYPVPDIAQALGVPPTDPLLLESLAQGYAMEMEYARILQQENEAKILNARKQRPKKYKCPHCHVGFSNNGQLKGHIRIHTGERPFKCEEKNCGKTFTRNEELTRHKRIHSGVRPYGCSTCGKKFGRRDHLKKHSRTHLTSHAMMPVFIPMSAIPNHGFPYLYGY